jgi:predicted flap endonuclease-1-like 5' DNA nuclease
MAWLEEFPSVARAQNAWRLPIGAASPLWAAFGAAAGAGVAYWWMTQWTRTANARTLPATPAHKVIAPAAVPAPTPEAPVLETPVAEAPAPEVESAAPAELAFEPAPAPEPLPDLPAPGDDLTVMTGIGPKLSEALAARGVTRFAQIAAWTDADLAEMDVALGLKGRAVREAWIAQAKRLAGA